MAFTTELCFFLSSIRVSVIVGGGVGAAAAVDGVERVSHSFTFKPCVSAPLRRMLCTFRRFTSQSGKILRTVERENEASGRAREKREKFETCHKHTQHRQNT